MHTVKEKKFWSRVSRAGEPFCCWLWEGPVDPAGYGRCHRTFDGKREQLAHRIAFIYARGPIAAGREVDHLCRVKLCCNPAHLDVCERAENMLRTGYTGSGVEGPRLCRKGLHPLVGDNLVVRKHQNLCRACRNASEIAAYHRNHEARKAKARADAHRLYWRNPEKFRARSRKSANPTHEAIP